MFFYFEDDIGKFARYLFSCSILIVQDPGSPLLEKFSPYGFFLTLAIYNKSAGCHPIEVWNDMKMTSFNAQLKIIFCEVTKCLNESSHIPLNHTFSCFSNTHVEYTQNQPKIQSYHQHINLPTWFYYEATFALTLLLAENMHSSSSVERETKRGCDYYLTFMQVRQQLPPLLLCFFYWRSAFQAWCICSICNLLTNECRII